MLEAFIGFLGVVIGALIVTLTNWKLFQKEYINQLKLAALEKRLSAHQQAYALWWRLMVNLTSKEKIGRIVIESQE